MFSKLTSLLSSALPDGGDGGDDGDGDDGDDDGKVSRRIVVLKGFHEK